MVLFVSASQTVGSRSTAQVVLCNMSKQHEEIEMSIDCKTVIQNSQFSLQEMDDEQLLYNPLLAKTIYMNNTATLILKLCNGRLTVGEIIETLTQQFPQSAVQIRIDVINAIDELNKNQAVFIR